MSYVAAKFFGVSRLTARVRPSVAAAACSSVFVQRVNEQRDGAKAPDERELVPSARGKCLYAFTRHAG